MKIVIIDGQGGRMGKAVIEQLKSSYPELELYAIGTNSIATSAMLKAGCLLWSHRRKSCDRQCQKRRPDHRAYWYRYGRLPDGGDHRCYGNRCKLQQRLQNTYPRKSLQSLYRRLSGRQFKRLYPPGL